MSILRKNISQMKHLLWKSKQYDRLWRENDRLKIKIERLEAELEELKKKQEEE